MDNLRIWKEVETTAPSATKMANLGGRPVTSISGTYMFKRATEVFGPVGDGWGYDVIEERFDKGAPIFVVQEDKTKLNVCDEVMHTLRVKLWYKNKAGERCEVQHYGHTPYIQSSKYGPYTDYDAPKKSMTDAIKKCLSMLGFSADVFMGMYDDVSYVEAAKVKESVDQAEKADGDITAQRTEFLEWCEREIQQYSKIPNAAALKMVHAGHIKKVERQCSLLNFAVDKIKGRFDRVYQARINELLPDMVCTSCGTIQKGKDGAVCTECGEKISPANQAK